MWLGILTAKLPSSSATRSPRLLVSWNTNFFPGSVQCIFHSLVELLHLVHIRYNLSTSKGSTMLPHTTDLWCRLRQKVYNTFEALRDGDPEFYFVQHLGDGKDGDDIEDGIQLN